MPLLLTSLQTTADSGRQKRAACIFGRSQNANCHHREEAKDPPKKSCKPEAPQRTSDALSRLYGSRRLADICDFQCQRACWQQEKDKVTNNNKNSLYFASLSLALLGRPTLVQEGLMNGRIQKSESEGQCPEPSNRTCQFPSWTNSGRSRECILCVLVNLCLYCSVPVHAFPHICCPALALQTLSPRLPSWLTSVRH